MTTPVPTLTPRQTEQIASLIESYVWARDHKVPLAHQSSADRAGRYLLWTGDDDDDGVFVADPTRATMMALGNGEPDAAAVIADVVIPSIVVAVGSPRPAPVAGEIGGCHAAGR